MSADMRAVLERAMQRVERRQLRLRVPRKDGLMEKHRTVHFHFRPGIFLRLSGYTEFRCTRGSVRLRADEIDVLPAGVPHGGSVGRGEDGQPFRNLVDTGSHGRNADQGRIFQVKWLVREQFLVMERKSRPGQYELLGVDDAPPYRVFWRPPMDLGSESVSFIATVDDLRGHRVATRLDEIEADTGGMEFGVDGATVPPLSERPAGIHLRRGEQTTRGVDARGAPPLEFQWRRDGRLIAGATNPSREVTTPGAYTVLVHNHAGTAVSSGTLVAATGSRTK